MLNHTNNSALKLIVAFGIFTAISCVEAKTEATLPGYDLSKPIKYNMPQRLFEISGIAFVNGDPSKVYAIQDEEGYLFSLGLKDKEAKLSKFAGKGDYEDLSISNNQVIILKSNGELHTMPLSGTNGDEATNVQAFKGLVPKAEYEGLYADEQANTIYVLNKQSKASKDTPIFKLKLAADGVLTPAGESLIAHSDIVKFTGDKKFKFHPSALAKNKATNEWFILSSVNKMIVVTDENFKIKAVYPLKGGYFNQPEGIAFDKDQNLYISNEGGTLQAGNILMFKHLQK
ncbi:SdiA-regulated family protein [Pedobacter changchengzhani]|uniref:SdiA-regulated family protein n=1 Tax=Pedobacter changchengzhani TaxID=2529274 RepID=A0A4V3A016_9SPHI|nr:SdiA-regulated domain-containing protein [Pedobacter changchengzhani]TDG35883.1 SdiA-regulated family protein [Pedobacter changchengzhani]